MISSPLLYHAIMYDVKCNVLRTLIYIYILYTVDREIVVLKIFHALKFHRAKFS